MTRPKADLPGAHAIRTLADAQGRLAVRVTPGARTACVEISGDSRLLVKVREKAEDGKANAAVIALLAQALGCPPSHLVLLRGATSREKLVGIATENRAAAGPAGFDKRPRSD